MNASHHGNGINHGMNMNGNHRKRKRMTNEHGNNVPFNDAHTQISNHSQSEFMTRSAFDVPSPPQNQNQNQNQTQT